MSSGHLIRGSGLHVLVVAYTVVPLGSFVQVVQDPAFLHGVRFVALMAQGGQLLLQHAQACHLGLDAFDMMIEKIIDALASCRRIAFQVEQCPDIGQSHLQ